MSTEPGRTPSPTPPQLPIDPATVLYTKGTVAHDLSCVKCGFNLLGLGADGVCPECGAPIADSIRTEAAEPTTAASLFRQLGPAGVLGAAWTFMPAIVGTTMLVYLDTVSKYIQSFGPRAIALYVGLFIVTAGLGLLPTYTQAILAGWCFGLSSGFPAALAGFVGASIIGYYVARTVAAHRVEETINSKPKAKIVRDALVGHGSLKTLGIVTLLRLPPNSPFALTNLVMASVGVRLWIFVIGTLVGMAPRTFLAVYIGHSLRQGMHQLTKEEIKNAAPWWAIYAGPGLMILVMIIIAAIAQRALAKVTQGRPEQASP